MSSCNAKSWKKNMRNDSIIDGHGLMLENHMVRGTSNIDDRSTAEVFVFFVFLILDADATGATGGFQVAAKWHQGAWRT